MSPDTGMNILTLTNTQAKELAGRLVTIGTETYYFRDYERDHPGQPPWRSGAEGKAFPLLDCCRSVVAYLKFFSRPTQKRLERTSWLIAQQIHTWLPGLVAAPMAWGDTRHARRPAEAPFDFAGCLAQAVPGKTWLELKGAIHENSAHLTEDFRWRCIRDLVLALSVLEQEGIVHGDLSPNNVVIDVEAPLDRPALYLIDFDAFLAPAAEGNAAVTVAEGGTYGTEGYCPPDLAIAAAEGDGSVAPYSDRYGRDMLLLELLIMDCGMSPDDPPSSWNHDQLQRRYLAWQARGDPRSLPILPHLEPATIFAHAEPDRPASMKLAADLGMSLPTRRLLRQRTRMRSSTPVVLGPRSPSTGIGQSSRRSALARPMPATLRFIVPWRWSRPEADPAYRTPWQDFKMAMGCAATLLLPLILALIVLLCKAIADLLGAR